VEVVDVEIAPEQLARRHVTPRLLLGDILLTPVDQGLQDAADQFLAGTEVVVEGRFRDAEALAHGTDPGAHPTQHLERQALRLDAGSRLPPTR
jgi:hypothetical protein